MDSEKHAPQARFFSFFFVSQNAPQAKDLFMKQNAPQARFLIKS